MNTTHVSTASNVHLDEIRARYRQMSERRSETSYRAHSLDGRHTLETGYESGGCMQDSEAWVKATRGKTPYFQHSTTSNTSFNTPAISSRGGVGYVVREGSRTEVCRVSLRNQLMPWPRKLFAIDGEPTAMSMSANDRSLLIADGRELKAWDCKPSLGTRFARIFDPTTGTTVTRLPDPISGMAPLSDGSVLVETFGSTQADADWNSGQTHFWRVPAGGQAPMLLPLRLVSEESWISNVQSALPFLRKKNVQAFDAQAPTLIDDQGNVDRVVAWRPTHSRWGNRSNEIVVAYPDGAGNTGVHSWDGTTLRTLSTLPGDDLREPNDQESQLAVKDNFTYVQMGDTAPRTCVIELQTGKVVTLPYFPAHKEMAADPGQKRSFAVLTRADDLHMVDIDSGAVISDRLMCKPDPERSTTLRWTPDGSQLLAVYTPKGKDTLTLEVRQMDGAQISVPDVENLAWMTDSELHVTVGGKTHPLSLPIDLNALVQNSWIERSQVAAILGGSTVEKDPGTVEREGDVLSIGGVRVPVRKGADEAPDVVEG